MNVRRIIDIARGRAEFKDNIRGHLDEILTNLSLIKNPSTPTTLKNHWKTELFSHLAPLSVAKLKNKDTEKARRRAFSEAIEKEDSLEARRKFMVSYSKFKKEGLGDQKEWFEAENENLNRILLTLLEFCIKGQVVELEEFVSKL